MKPLELDEILDIDTYESIRADYRARVLVHKDERRVSVGERVTLAFEDRETVRYQVQEMARVERTRAPEKIQHELDVYNALVPGYHELSATLFIEIPELDQVRSELDRLVGIDEHVALLIGSGDAAHVARADFDSAQMEADRISAVHYIRFALSGAAVEALAAGEPAWLQIDHAAYTAEARLAPATIASLLRDLDDDAACLLEPARIARAAPAPDEILREGERWRSLRPARPAAPQHIIVEATDGSTSLADADAGLLAEMLQEAQRCAAGMLADAGRARILTDVDTDAPAASARLRFHVLALD